MARSKTASVPFVLVTLVLDTLGFGLVIPVLPRLLEDLVRGDAGAVSGYYGAFVALYAAMQFVFAPVLGGLSDRFGRRPVILASAAGLALDYLVMALAPNLAWLFVGRIISGITGAGYAAAYAYVADVTPPERRAQGFGLLGAAFGLGLVVGPALGGLLGSVHLRLPFIVAMGLNLAAFVYGLVVLPESLRADKRRAFSLARANVLASLANLGRYPIVIGLTGTLVCTILAQAMLQAVWPVYGDQRFGWGPLAIGLSLTTAGVSHALVQGGLVHAVIPRLGERRTVVAGLVLSAIGYVGFGLATAGWMMYVAILPAALGGLASPAQQALISREVPPTEQGELQGSIASLMSGLSVAGPLLAMWLYASFTQGGERPYVPGAPFYAGAALNLLGLAFALRLFARTAPPPATEAGAGPAV